MMQARPSSRVSASAPTRARAQSAHTFAHHLRTPAFSFFAESRSNSHRPSPPPLLLSFCRSPPPAAAARRAGLGLATAESVLGSWVKPCGTRLGIRNKEYGIMRRTPTQNPSTDRPPARACRAPSASWRTASAGSASSWYARPASRRLAVSTFKLQRGQGRVLTPPPLRVRLWLQCTQANRVLVCAARTLNATGQPRVTLSPRQEQLRAVRGPRQEQKGPDILPNCQY